jgi:hypothetical protein
MPPKRQVVLATDPVETSEEPPAQPSDIRQPSLPPSDIHQPSLPPSDIRQQSVLSDTSTPNLAEAISLMTEELRRREKHPVTKVKEPDTFDGSDPRKLNNFILLCNLYFRQNSAYSDDSAKVNFALSHLRGLALDLFEPDILDSEDTPEWLEDWPSFLRSLRSHFGPIDPIGDAEDSIDNLKMRENQQIVKYDVEFNRLAIRTGWNNTVLRHRYYSGLAERIKDIMGQQVKPSTLNDTKKLAYSIDARYWERLREKTRSDKSSSRSDNRSDNKSDKRSNDSQGSNSDNHSATKPHSHSHSHDHDTKSGQSSNSNSGNSDNPAYPDKLVDGKLTSQERQRRLDNDLCLYCGETGHKALDCTKKGSSSSKAKGRAAKAEEQEITTPSTKD